MDYPHSSHSKLKPVRGSADWLWYEHFLSGLTAEEFAAALNVTPVELAEMESGDRAISDEIITLAERAA